MQYIDVGNLNRGRGREREREAASITIVCSFRNIFHTIQSLCLLGLMTDAHRIDSSSKVLFQFKETLHIPLGIPLNAKKLCISNEVIQ
jgi:hypothetical protein